MRARILSLMLVGASVSACPEEWLLKEGESCQNDKDCERAYICLLGKCTDPRAKNLGKVDLEVAPASESGLRPQVFADLDTTRSAYGEFALRPTLNASVEVCHHCDQPDRGSVAGTLFLTGPERILGHPQRETVGLDIHGHGNTGLLGNTTYDSVVWPEDPTAPILRGMKVFVSESLSHTLDIEVPDPGDIYKLTGVVVADARANPAVGVDGMRVWALAGHERLTRDVITAEGGTFELRIPRSSSSGLSIWVAPTNAAEGWPWVSVEGVNLDGDKHLGHVDLGVSTWVVIRGKVLGPAGQLIPGSTVRLIGEAGRGTLRASASAENGTYELRVPEGTYQRATIPPTGLGAALKQEDSIRVPPDNGQSPTEMDITLGPPARLCGKVKDSDGDGVGSAGLTASRIGNFSMGPGPAADIYRDVRALAADDGAFCVDLDPGQYLVIGEPPSGNKNPRRTDLVNIGLEPVDHDILLPPAAFITGKVMGPDSQPIKRARIRAYSPVLSTSLGALELGSAFTDDQGGFSMAVPDLAEMGQR